MYIPKCHYQLYQLNTIYRYYNQAIMEEHTQKEQQIIDKNKLYVSNLDAEISVRKTESDLKQIFTKFGKVASINVKKNQKYKKLYAFVVFYQASEAASAVDSLNGEYIGDRKIKVEYQKTHKQARQQPREERDDRDREVSRSGKYMNAVTCYRCGKVGHFARECRQKPQNQQRNRNRDKYQGNRHRRRSYSRSRSHDKKKRISSSSSSSSSISEKKGREKSSSSSSSGSSSA